MTNSDATINTPALFIVYRLYGFDGKLSIPKGSARKNGFNSVFLVKKEGIYGKPNTSAQKGLSFAPP